MSSLIIHISFLTFVSFLPGFHNQELSFEGLSRMKGNFHVRFLGGKGASGP
jgi:hypothetical protein